MRVIMRDSARRASFVDGSGNPLDLGAGNKPGFRVPVNDKVMNDRRAVVRDSYFRAGMLARNRWKVGDLQQAQCTACFGEGVDEDGEECPMCNGSGVLPDERERPSKGKGGGYGSGNEGGYKGGSSDSRSFDQMMRDHAQNMTKIYDAYSQEIATAYLKG